ncbi:hypothetical protein H2203_004715 [Taxawa tesnikishii (nom. ined.)]|nr:hypothetical protein H2203_004715 [Dothideales sp. JES 119]
MAATIGRSDSLLADDLDPLSRSAVNNPRDAHITTTDMLVLAFISSLLSASFLFFVVGAQQIPLSSSNAATTPRYQLGSSAFNATIEAFLTNNSIPGLSLAITKSDRLVYASSYGYADATLQIPVNTTHRFRQASVSKTVTAVTALYLVQQGNLSLDDTVFGDNGVLGTKYGCEPYSTWTTNVTVRNLLEHSSGFLDADMSGGECDETYGCDPTYRPEWLGLDQWSLVDAILSTYQPTHEPGTVANYSNFGYFVLGRVIEEVSGITPYASFVQDEILWPLLGIRGMEIASDETKVNEVVYYAREGEDEDAPYGFHVARRDSVGAWIASPMHLVKMLTAIDGLARRNDILNAAMREMMFTRSNVEGSKYGLGWDEIVEDREGKTRRATKSGGYPGTNSWVVIDFENEVSYAVVVNREVPKAHGGGKALKELIDGIVAGVEEWPDHDLFNSTELHAEGKAPRVASASKDVVHLGVRLLQAPW